MSTLAEQEFNYMPSNWSKRYKPELLLTKYFEFCEDVTERVRKSIEHVRDVSYGHGQNMKYDYYGCNLPAAAPILLFIHGGYWQEFSKDLSGFSVPLFVANGIKVIVAGYDLCPNVTLTEIVKEIKDLTDHVLKLANDWGSKDVWIMGHSAGAHLAASLIHDHKWLENCRKIGHAKYLRGLILVSGIYVLEPLLTISVNEKLKLTSEEIKQYTFSPFESVDSGDEKETEALRDIKVVVAVGEDDSPIFIEESRRYSRRLTKLVDNVEYLLLRGVDHFDIVEKLIHDDFALSRLIINNMRAQKEGETVYKKSQIKC